MNDDNDEEYSSGSETNSTSDDDDRGSDNTSLPEPQFLSKSSVSGDEVINSNSLMNNQNAAPSWDALATNARRELLSQLQALRQRHKKGIETESDSVTIVRKNHDAGSDEACFTKKMLSWLNNTKEENIDLQSKHKYFKKYLQVSQYWISNLSDQDTDISCTTEMNSWNFGPPMEMVYHQCVRAILWGEVKILDLDRQKFVIESIEIEHHLSSGSETRNIDAVPFKTNITSPLSTKIMSVGKLSQKFHEWFLQRGEQFSEIARANVTGALYGPYFKKMIKGCVEIPKIQKTDGIDLNNLINAFSKYAEQVAKYPFKAYGISNPMGMLGMVPYIKFQKSDSKYSPSIIDQKTKAKLLENLIYNALTIFCVGQHNRQTELYTGFLHSIQSATIVMRYMCNPAEVSNDFTIKPIDKDAYLYETYVKILKTYTQFYKGNHAPIYVGLIAKIVGLRLVVQKMMTSKYIGTFKNKYNIDSQLLRPRYNLTLHHFMQTSQIFDPTFFENEFKINTFRSNDPTYIAVMEWVRKEIVEKMSTDDEDKFNHFVIRQWGTISKIPDSIPTKDKDAEKTTCLRKKGYSESDVAWGFLFNNIHNLLETRYPIENFIQNDKKINFEDIFLKKNPESCFPYAVVMDQESFFCKDNKSRISDPSTWKVVRWLWRKLNGSVIGNNDRLEGDVFILPIFPLCCYENERGGNPVFMVGESNTGKSTNVCFNAFFANAFLPKRYHTHLVYNKIKNDPMILDFGEVAGLDFIMPPQQITGTDIDLNQSALKRMCIYIDDVSGDKAITPEVKSIITNFVSNMSEAKLTLILALQTLTGTGSITSIKQVVSNSPNSYINLTGFFQKNDDVYKTFKGIFDISKNHVGKILDEDKQVKILEFIKASQQWLIPDQNKKIYWWIGITSTYVCSSLPLFGPQAPGQFFYSFK
jgi:hypothetical protein